MKRIATTLVLTLLCCSAFGQRIEKVPFGDFERWTVREIKESAIIGGETKRIYVVAPNDTIRKNEVYSYNRSNWTSSNAYAVVTGVTKTSCNVFPDVRREGNRCAKLETAIASVKVAGLINISVLAGGALFWGKTFEPISSINNPYSKMEWGIPFTKRPTAFIVDYKATIPNTGTITKVSLTKRESWAGEDPAQMYLILQQRWEDASGNIHARRVGTACQYVRKSTSGWVNSFRVPVVYGKSSSLPLFKGEKTLYASNSKGKLVPILEDEWGTPETPVTHALLLFSSGSMNAYVGALGNILWVDNVRLEYAE